MEETSLVPFGKYRNQPLAQLAADKSYCDWLLQQGWLGQRYPELRTLIINNFGEPEETPEHNALQLQFLDEEMRKRVTYLLCMEELTHEGLPGTVWGPPGAPIFESRGIDVKWEWGVSWGEPFEGGILEQYGKCRVAVECKPSLGDDYPAVLRHILSRKDPSTVDAVVYQEFTASGGTLSQVKAFFRASRVGLFSWEEIAATRVPRRAYYNKQKPLAYFKSKGWTFWIEQFKGAPPAIFLSPPPNWKGPELVGMIKRFSEECLEEIMSWPSSIHSFSLNNNFAEEIMICADSEEPPPSVIEATGARLSLIHDPHDPEEVSRYKPPPGESPPPLFRLLQNVKGVILLHHAGLSEADLPQSPAPTALRAWEYSTGNHA
jgi:hypothetical protein